MTLIEKIIRTEGHLIDSGLLRRVFDTVISDGGRFEGLDFTIGRNNDEFSRARIKINADDVVDMNTILLKLSTPGCVIDKEETVTLAPAPADGVVPPDFYSTTNHETFIQLDGSTIKVERLRMDGVIVVNLAGTGSAVAFVKKFRDVKKGDDIVVGDGARLRCVR